MLLKIFAKFAIVFILLNECSEILPLYHQTIETIVNSEMRYYKFAKVQ